jgi:chaperonin GroES
MSLNEERIKKIRPIHDRILVKRIDDASEKTSGGIYIPEQSKERAQIGEVVSFGSGKILSSGNVQQMNVKKGDMVFFGKFAGTEVSEDYLIIREDEVLGIL